MNNKFCCEEMEAFVEAIKQATSLKEEEGSLKLFEDNGIPDELMIPVGSRTTLPNLIFRFCPYCGKILHSDEPVVTQNELLNQISQALGTTDMTEENLQRRAAALEEVVDRVRAAVNAACAAEGTLHVAKK